MLIDVDTCAFVMNCYHYLVGEYELDINGSEILVASYMKYSAS